jgi:hypothetical protein
MQILGEVGWDWDQLLTFWVREVMLEDGIGQAPMEF